MIILAIQYSVDWWRSTIVGALEKKSFLRLHQNSTNSTDSTTRWNRELILVVLIDLKMLEAGADGLHHQTCPTSALLLYYISISISPPLRAVSPSSPTERESTETFFATHQLTFLRSERFFFIHFYRKNYKKHKDSRTLKKQESN